MIFTCCSRDANLTRFLCHFCMERPIFCSCSIIAGHGNHFQQSYTLAYGAITEPIFARLGVFASARNFGVGGLGTLHAGMAISAYVFAWARPAFGLVVPLGLLSHTLLPLTQPVRRRH